METENELLSSLSFASSSYTSNGSSSQNLHPSGYEPVTNPELLSLAKLSGCLEKLLLDAEYNYSDAEIVVEGTSVSVNRCILASRSSFFHDLFKKSNASSQSEGKPKYLMTELVPHGKIGYETFMVFLNYVYTGKLRPSPPEVSTCVDESCAHDACGPAINYAVELMYASATFQMKELVMVVQRRLLNFVDKAFVEDVIPIIMVAFHCELNQLQLHCVQRISASDLDNLTLEKELPHVLFAEIKSSRDHSQQELKDDAPEVDPLYNKRVRRIHKALDSDDVELLELLLEESEITLDDAHALHYAVAYCNPKVVSKVLILVNADLNLINSRGYTVLHVAARRKDPTIIVDLLSKGARVSDTTFDGQTAITICRRLTRPKDYNESTTQGRETNTDKMCIEVLEREMLRNPLAGNISVSSMMVADDLFMRLLLLENRVALARVLFPREAKLAMQIAHADSTSEFRGLQASKSSSGNLREVDLNEIPSEQVKRLQMRLKPCRKQDEMHGTLLLEEGPPEEQSVKKMRYMELKDEVMKAFDKDKAENNWASFSSSSSCSSSPKGGIKSRKRPVY